MKLKRIAGAIVGITAMTCCVGKPAKGSEGFGDYISPVSNPTNFEDPRAVTDVRPIFVVHKLSDKFSVGDGGEAYLLALQARVAITDKFSIIATKDGILWLDPKEEIDGALEDGVGFANLAFGVKYTIVENDEAGHIISLGMRYEAPSGSSQVLQGKVFQIEGIDDHGSGLLNPFITGGMEFENFHLLGYAGVRAALDDVTRRSSTCRCTWTTSSAISTRWSRSTGSRPSTRAVACRWAAKASTSSTSARRTARARVS